MNTRQRAHTVKQSLLVYGAVAAVNLGRAAGANCRPLAAGDPSRDVRARAAAGQAVDCANLHTLRRAIVLHAQLWQQPCVWQANVHKDHVIKVELLATIPPEAWVWWVGEKMSLSG